MSKVNTPPPQTSGTLFLLASMKKANDSQHITDINTLINENTKKPQIRKTQLTEKTVGNIRKSPRISSKIASKSNENTKPETISKITRDTPVNKKNKFDKKMLNAIHMERRRVLSRS